MVEVCTVIKKLQRKDGVSNMLLPDNVRKYLVLENCENVSRLLIVWRSSEKVNIPVVFDTHHYACYKQLHPDEKYRDASYYIPEF